MNLRLLAPCVALALGVVALTGCGAAPIRQITTDGTHYSPLLDPDIKDDCQSNARLCVLEPVAGGFMGGVNRSRTAIFGEVFANTAQRALSAEECDLGITYPNTWNDSVQVVDPNGKFLARVEAGGSLQVARALCHALEEGRPLAAKLAGIAPSFAVAPPGSPARPPRVYSLMGAHAPAAAPSMAAPAPAQGLSAADIERIAKAVQGTAAPVAASAASFPASPAPNFAASERPDDLAVIVGIESYSDIASKASYAERDADAFKAHVRALGVPERNIVLLKGSKAGKASLEKNLDAWLPRLAKADRRVYFFFSGHGAPDVKTGQAYLVPWDGDPNFLDSTAYPVAKLYKTLGALPAKQVLVAMDSCFSGAGGRSVLASGARPLVGKIDTGAVPAKITVLAASASNEISGSLDDKGHGAFTYFLLQGLDSGKTTPKALSDYLTPRVQDEARRLNRDQTPQLQGDGSWSLR